MATPVTHTDNVDKPRLGWYLSFSLRENGRYQYGLGLILIIPRKRHSRTNDVHLDCIERSPDSCNHNNSLHTRLARMSTIAYHLWSDRLSGGIFDGIPSHRVGYLMEKYPHQYACCTNISIHH